MPRIATRVEARKDPKPRAAGFHNAFSLKNPDPNKKYCWVNKAAPADGQGVDYYEMLGYGVECASTSGPRPLGVKVSDGAEIEIRGHVLMSVDIDRYREIVQYGPYGDTGQADADAKERRMIRRRNGVDPLRGMGDLHGRSGSPAIYAEAEVSGLQTEMGVS